MTSHGTPAPILTVADFCEASGHLQQINIQVPLASGSDSQYRTQLGQLQRNDASCIQSMGSLHRRCEQARGIAACGLFPRDGPESGKASVTIDDLPGNTDGRLLAEFYTPVMAGADESGGITARPEE